MPIDSVSYACASYCLTILNSPMLTSKIYLCQLTAMRVPHSYACATHRHASATTQLCVCHTVMRVPHTVMRVPPHSYACATMAGARTCSLEVLCVTSVCDIIVLREHHVFLLSSSICNLLRSSFLTHVFAQRICVTSSSCVSTTCFSCPLPSATC